MIGKKGNITQTTTYIVSAALLLLTLVGVIVGVTAFKTTQEGKANCGLNATGGTATPLYTQCSSAWNLTKNTGVMSNKLGEQLPTVGTMFGVSLILAAIGLIGYGLYRGGQMM